MTLSMKLYYFERGQFSNSNIGPGARIRFTSNSSSYSRTHFGGGARGGKREIGRRKRCIKGRGASGKEVVGTIKADLFDTPRVRATRAMNRAEGAALPRQRCGLRQKDDDSQPRHGREG